jgi:antagonist of KipI
MVVGRGGVQGRPLKRGDELRRAGAPPKPAVAGRTLPELSRPPYSPEPEVPAVAGPHARRLGRTGRRAFFKERWAVSRDSDRMGYRLEGSELPIEGPELLSFGLAMGCVQVPASGQPILLMADHQTAGGYPVVAGVARAALPLVAQLLPGDHLSFREVSVERAQAEWRSLRAALDGLRG